MTMSAPSLARRRATARPRRLAEPVTRATRFVSEAVIVVERYMGWLRSVRVETLARDRGPKARSWVGVGGRYGRVEDE